MSKQKKKAKQGDFNVKMSLKDGVVRTSDPSASVTRSVLKPKWPKKKAR